MLKLSNVLEIINNYLKQESIDRDVGTKIVNNILLNNELTLIPEQDINGQYNIIIIAYDDSLYYESNTLRDTTEFILDIKIVVYLIFCLIANLIIRD